MSEFTEQRLSKLAKEYSIGVHAITDFLKGKGHAMESNPNAKISAELVALVAKEFQSEKAKGEEAAKVTASHQDIKKESITLAEDAKRPESKKEEEKEDLIIKNVPTPTAAEKEKTNEKVSKKVIAATALPIAEPEIIKPEVKPEVISGVKVVGEIDLDKINSKTRPDKKLKKEKETAPKKPAKTLLVTQIKGWKKS